MDVARPTLLAPLTGDKEESNGRMELQVRAYANGGRGTVSESGDV